jgi:hypothetical protein
MTISFSTRCAYIQLDDSSKVSEPYAYSIPLAIEQNEAFPLGFCIAPSESIELYSTFFLFMIMKGANPVDIFGKPLLSDHEGIFYDGANGFLYDPERVRPGHPCGRGHCMTE